MSKAAGRFTFALRMTAAGRFIAALQQERRSGHVAFETEERLRRAFRTLGSDPPESALTAAIGSEIERVEREAATLRKLQAELFGEG
jgi:hypothetical protein